MEMTFKSAMKNVSVILTCIWMTLTGCTKEPAPITVNSVTLSPTAMTLAEGESQTLTATIAPSNAENKNVTWSTSDAAIATVTNGKVTAVKAGKATITVTTEDGAKTAKCEVTVNAKSISTEVDDGNLNYGEAGGAGDNIDEENDIYDGGSF